MSHFDPNSFAWALALIIIGIVVLRFPNGWTPPGQGTYPVAYYFRVKLLAGMLIFLGILLILSTLFG